MNLEDDKKPRFVIAATIKDGEPRYVAAVMDKGHFDYLKIVRGYEVLTMKHAFYSYRTDMPI